MFTKSDKIALKVVMYRKKLSKRFWFEPYSYLFGVRGKTDKSYLPKFGTGVFYGVVSLLYKGSLICTYFLYNYGATQQENKSVWRDVGGKSHEFSKRLLVGSDTEQSLFRECFFSVNLWVMQLIIGFSKWQLRNLRNSTRQTDFNYFSLHSRTISN